MKNPNLFELSKIHPNPWQPREREDAEHVEQVARSIAAQGLLQTPVGRSFNGNQGSVELAFGHTRLAAYEWLDEHNPSGEWAKMPVVVQDLNDEQMFELGISENLARQDLTNIEVARAMVKYREAFGKSSAEIGELFGLSESAVRNKMRLLNLPAVVQEKLGAGELSEGTGRKLLSMQKLAPEKVVDMAQALADGGYERPEEIGEAISRELRTGTKGVKEMWNGRWKEAGEKPCGGDGLWPLTWTPKGHQLDFRDFKKLWGKRDGPAGNTLSRQFDQCWNLLVRDLGHTQETLEKVGLNGELVGMVMQLRAMPACTACEYHTAIEGVHYCGMEECWKYKRGWWYEKELTDAIAKLGIPEYVAKADGPYEPLSSYREEHQEWVAEKADHLRLRVKYQSWRPNDFTDSHCVEVVSVRPEVAERKERVKKETAERDAQWKNRQIDWEIQHENIKRSQQFIQDVAAPLFAVKLEGLNTGVLKDLARSLMRHREDLQEMERSALLIDLASFILFDSVDPDVRIEGPEKAAKHLSGVAKTWGVKLPDDWYEIAKKYERSDDEDEEID